MSKTHPKPDLTKQDRRLKYLRNLEVRAPVRAEIAGVKPNDLPAYIDELQELGLLDAGERITVAGTIFRAVGDKPGIEMRDIWRIVGGAEENIRQTLDRMAAKKLIVFKNIGQGSGYYLTK